MKTKQTIYAIVTIVSAFIMLLGVTGDIQKVYAPIHAYKPTEEFTPNIDVQNSTTSTINGTDNPTEKLSPEQLNSTADLAQEQEQQQQIAK